MAKTQVYSWRVAADLKAELQREARRADQSLGALLDRIAREWLQASRSNGADPAEQKRLHKCAAKCIGVLHGGNPYRAEQAPRAIRARLAARHGRQRSH